MLLRPSAGALEGQTGAKTKNSMLDLLRTSSNVRDLGGLSLHVDQHNLPPPLPTLSVCARYPNDLFHQGRALLLWPLPTPRPHARRLSQAILTSLRQALELGALREGCDGMLLAATVLDSPGKRSSVLMLLSPMGISAGCGRCSFHWSPTVLQKVLHRLDLGLLRSGDGRGKSLNFRAVGEFEDGLGHPQSGLVVGNHELKETDVRLLREHFLEFVYPLGRSHPRHPTLGGVAHPAHGGPCPGSWETPGGEPTLHLADLALLADGEREVRFERVASGLTAQITRS